MWARNKVHLYWFKVNSFEGVIYDTWIFRVTKPASPESHVTLSQWSTRQFRMPVASSVQSVPMCKWALQHIATQIHCNRYAEQFKQKHQLNSCDQENNIKKPDLIGLQQQRDLKTKQLKTPGSSICCVWQAQPHNLSVPEAKKNQNKYNSQKGPPRVEWQLGRAAPGAGDEAGEYFSFCLSVSSGWRRYRRSYSPGMSSGALPNFASPPEGALISQFCSVTAGVNCLLISEIPCFLHSIPKKYINPPPQTLGFFGGLLRNKQPWGTFCTFFVLKRFTNQYCFCHPYSFNAKQ